MSFTFMSLKGRLKGFLAGMGLAMGLALPGLAQPAMPNRLALVIGEASYNGDTLQTTANDAALMAQSLRNQGFAVTELHDLNTASLAAQYQAFLAQVRQAPQGVAVSVYLGGLAVTVGCDDYLLPVDAQIHAPSDVPPISLSMTRVMQDLSQISTTMNLVMLDGARPIPASVSSVSFARGLIGLTPPTATTFSLSAEIHDMLPAPQPTDQNDAYAAAFASVSATPTPDIETMLHLLRLDVHQATAGAQTPWQQTSPTQPPFVFDASATQASLQAAAASYLSDSGPLTGMDAETAYYTAIWRNDIATYQAYLAQFSTTGNPSEVARAQYLLQLLEIPNPVCSGQQATLPLPVMPPPVVVGGPECPPGYVIGYEADGDAYCTPPVVISTCPPGYEPHWVDGHMACWWHCPPVNFRRWDHDHWGCYTCPPGERPAFINGHWVCHIPCLPVQNGLGAWPEPWCCPPGSTPERTGHGWVCGQPCPIVNGGIVTQHVCCPPGEHKVRNGIDTFTCQPDIPPGCLQGTINCPPPPPPPLCKVISRDGAVFTNSPNCCPPGTLPQHGGPLGWECRRLVPPPPPPCQPGMTNCPAPPNCLQRLTGPPCPPQGGPNGPGTTPCPPGTHPVLGVVPARCVPNTPVTACPVGQRKIGNACVPIVLPPPCPRGEIRIGNGCGPATLPPPCPNGEHRNAAGACVLVPPVVLSCQTGFHHPPGSMACLPDGAPPVTGGPTHPPVRCPVNEHPVPGGCAPNVVFHPVQPHLPPVPVHPPVIVHPPVLVHPVPHPLEPPKKPEQPVRIQ
ncbi:MAG: caspase family protein [Hyphomicrobiales bacterium]|nr:caspase family protein [Hyphomicrobiales bacterium]